MARRFAWGRRYTVQSTDKDPVLQSFLLRLLNDGGVLKHHLSAGSVPTITSSLGLFSWKVNGASLTSVATPVVDGSTPFASGAGVYASGTHVLLLDTVDQVGGEMFTAAAGIAYNNTGTAGVVCEQVQISSNVNGVTRMRYGVALTIDGSGAAFNINVTNIPSGKEMRIRIGPIALY